LVLGCHHGNVPVGYQRRRNCFTWSIGNQMLFKKLLLVQERIGAFGFAKVVGIAAG
jgi:hypothetical protein